MWGIKVWKDPSQNFVHRNCGEMLLGVKSVVTGKVFKEGVDLSPPFLIVRADFHFDSAKTSPDGQNLNSFHEDCLKN
jgi:hypothetical protein